MAKKQNVIAARQLREKARRLLSASLDKLNTTLSDGEHKRINTAMEILRLARAADDQSAD